MSESHPSAATMAERDVLIERLFDAPRELVFNAWLDPDQLRHWFAPQGCSVHFRKIEPHQGGGFLLCIRSADGHECWCRGVYLEITPPERLVCTMAIADENGNVVPPASVGMDPDWPAETVLTVTFADTGGKTKLTLHQTVSESLAKRTGAHPSWLQMLDRLADTLAKH